MTPADLVARLLALKAGNINLQREAADTLTSQAREIERLKLALDEIRTYECANDYRGRPPSMYVAIIEAALTPQGGDRGDDNE